MFCPKAKWLPLKFGKETVPARAKSFLSHLHLIY